MLAALFQLLQFFYVDVLTYGRHLASQEDPAACQLGTFDLAIADHLELLLHDGGWGGEHPIGFDDILLLVFVGAVGSDGEILMVAVPEGKFEVVKGELIPAILAHELDGGLDELACFKF